MVMAKETLRDLIPPSNARVSIDGIIRLVAEYYGVPVRDLMGKRRTKSIAYPRQICMFLARKLTSHSLQEIGGYFGGRDHTTVLYSEDRIRTLMADDHDLRSVVERLKRNLQRG